jgi:hypothetical protein
VRVESADHNQMPGKTEVDEVDERRNESDHGDEGHDGDVAEGVAVELEARWLGEEHGAHEGALGGVEARAHDHGQRRSFVVVVVLVRAAGADDLGAREEHVASDLGVHSGSAQVE